MKSNTTEIVYFAFYNLLWYNHLNDSLSERFLNHKTQSEYQDVTVLILQITYVKNLSV
jgi:hypothetical protein